MNLARLPLFSHSLHTLKLFVSVVHPQYWAVAGNSFINYWCVVAKFLSKIFELLHTFMHESTQAWKHTRVWQGWFSPHNYLATLTTNWVKIFTGLLFCAYVEIYQVRQLVFDNYQRCPVYLKSLILIVSLSFVLQPICPLYPLIGQFMFFSSNDQINRCMHHNKMTT